MDVSKMIFAVCVSVLLLSQLLTANPMSRGDNQLKYVTGTEVELANEMSRALLKLMADINRHTSKRSRPRRYITFTIGADYYKHRPRRPHHHRPRPHHHQQLNSHGGNQLVSQ